MKNAFSYNLATSPVVTKTNTSVRNWMSNPVISIDSYTRLTDARRIMNANNIRTLPVVNDGELIGIITRRDLLRYDPSAMMKSNWDQYVGIGSQAVARIMTKNVATIKADASIAQAARVMLENKFSGLPVLNKKRELIGIITSSDLFRFIIENANEFETAVTTANLMSKNLETIPPYANLLEAHRIMGIKRIRTLPVVDEGKLIGIVTRTDLLSADPSSFASKHQQEVSRRIESTPVRYIMTSKPITIFSDTLISEAARLMLDYKIHSLPVMDHENELIGVLTETDLFRMILQISL